MTRYINNENCQGCAERCHITYKIFSVLIGAGVAQSGGRLNFFLSVIRAGVKLAPA